MEITTAYQYLSKKETFQESKKKIILENNKKVICRYGLGCTHIQDPVHKEKFWHPAPPIISESSLKNRFICYECGFSTSSLQALRVHLIRKTAWSNYSLIGCRINCLIDNKEWHEAFVMQFHKSGKHLVDFRLLEEKRWIYMSQIAFYIVDRPSTYESDETEFKDNLDDLEESNLSFETKWTYSESITNDYTFAQSALFKIYGNSIQETGHLTKGHICLTEYDKLNAQSGRGSLLYGELLPRGANKAFLPNRLDAASATCLFDMGMGTGKILIQAFLQFRNLKYLFGVELSVGRFKIAQNALLNTVKMLNPEHYRVKSAPGNYILVKERIRTPSYQSESRQEERMIYLQCGNMFDINNINIADIVMMETDIPTELYPSLRILLTNLSIGAKLLTYLDLRKIWEPNSELGAFPFEQFEINKSVADRYPTSWSVQRGHHFYLWKKIQLNGTKSQPTSMPHSVAGDESPTVIDNPDYQKCFPLKWSFRPKSKKKDKTITPVRLSVSSNNLETSKQDSVVSLSPSNDPPKTKNINFLQGGIREHEEMGALPNKNDSLFSNSESVHKASSQKIFFPSNDIISYSLDNRDLIFSPDKETTSIDDSLISSVKPNLKEFVISSRNKSLSDNSLDTSANNLTDQDPVFSSDIRTKLRSNIRSEFLDPIKKSSSNRGLENNSPRKDKERKSHGRKALLTSKNLKKEETIESLFFLESIIPPHEHPSESHSESTSEPPISSGSTIYHDGLNTPNEPILSAPSSPSDQVEQEVSVHNSHQSQSSCILS